MGQTRLDATLLAGPASSGESVFPGMTASVPVNLTPNPKSFTKATGVLTGSVAVADPSWQTLDGLGASSIVTQANLIYFRSSAAISLRVTQTVTGTGSVVTVRRVSGLCILEVPDSEPITLLEVQGTGTIEYFVQGNS